MLNARYRAQLAACDLRQQALLVNPLRGHARAIADDPRLDVLAADLGVELEADAGAERKPERFGFGFG